MALTNYAELQLSVADWMHRTNLTGNIPDFITLAEARIRAILEAQFQDKVGTLATVGAQNYVTMPSDLLRVHSLSIANTAPSIDYVTPAQLNAAYTDGNAGIPHKYTIIGDRVYFGPTPDRAYSISCVYQMAVPALSATAPANTNSLLTKWPNVYLWAALTEAAKYCRDRESQASFNSDFAEAISAVNIIEWHKGGPLRQVSDVRSV